MGGVDAGPLEGAEGADEVSPLVEGSGVEGAVVIDSMP